MGAEGTQARPARSVTLPLATAHPAASPLHGRAARLRDMAVTENAPPVAKPARWTAQWKELYSEVVQTNLCTGCAGCVISCPHDVIGYTHEPGAYKPFHLEDELGPDNCIHGEKGCTTCTRACPRFRSWKARPGVAATKEQVLESAGSRYTYSANTMALPEAVAAGHQRLALVGMSCQSSVPPIMWSRKVGKVSKPILFNIGLLCSKTFDDSIFFELFETKYDLPIGDITKMNIKGVFQIWMRDGSYHEIPLKECHAWTRDGCSRCPDFAAEHADISTGGIGKDNDWTLTIVRTDLGREIISRMIDDGSIIARPGDEDPGAIALMNKLAAKSRERWPDSAADEPKIPVSIGKKPA